MEKPSLSGPEKSHRILIVEDDRSMRKGLVLELRDRGYTVHEAETLAAGLKALDRIDFDLLITDLRLPDKEDGIRLVGQLKQRSPRTPALIITAFGSIAAAVKAMQAGAEDFVTKGFTIDELIVKIEKIFARTALWEEKERLNSENVTLKTELERLLPQWELIGSSPLMADLKNRIREYAATDFTILIQGETGTGKELVARAIHRAGPRRLKPFIVINCSAIPRELLESELFGHEKGSFTGATAKKIGQFEGAHGGVLFLDEVGDLDYGLQAKVLRAIEYKEFTRIGGTRPVTVDVQIIAATNRSLFGAVGKEKFREDLYYRLNVMVITVPPLRERPEDIAELSRHFLNQYSEEAGTGSFGLAPTALEQLTSYNWPGNIRELKNVIIRAAALTRSKIITAQSLGLPVEDRETPPFAGKRAARDHAVGQECPDPGSFKVAQDELTGKFVHDALKASRGRIRLAARMLGVSRNTFKKMMLKAHLSEHDFTT